MTGSADELSWALDEALDLVKPRDHELFASWFEESVAFVRTARDPPPDRAAKRRLKSLASAAKLLESALAADMGAANERFVFGAVMPDRPTRTAEMQSKKGDVQTLVGEIRRAAEELADRPVQAGGWSLPTQKLTAAANAASLLGWFGDREASLYADGPFMRLAELIYQAATGVEPGAPGSDMRKACQAVLAEQRAGRDLGLRLKWVVPDAE